MKLLLRFLLFALAILVISSCAYKRLAKKASEFEQQGMYSEASDLYYQSLIKKSDYIDSRLGLKRTGQRVLDNKYSKFNKAYNQGNNKQAVYYYLEATDFEKKLDNVGIELTVPPYYEEYYNEVKGTYLDDQYFKGKKCLNNEEFKKAENIFREIIRIDKDYKDSKERLNIAIYEPKYRDAVKNMGEEKYRTAYYLFDEILKNYGSYKEASDLKEKCQDKATIKIAVKEFKNSSTNKKIDDQLRTKIAQDLSSSNNPFIKVVEMPSSASASDSKPGRVSKHSATKSINPDVILTGHILSYNYDMGRLKKENKRGYLEVKKRYKDSEGNTKTKTTYKKVNYNEYKMKRGVSINFSFKIVDTKNNEIMLTNNFNISNQDRIHYADYEGKKKDLVPGYWKHKSSDSEEDVIKNNRRDVRYLQNLLSSRKKIKTYDALTNELLNNISNSTVNKITSYNPEK